MTTRSKLAVILHADVVGSTALVQKDEGVAHERIRDAFRKFSEIIVCYGGIAHEVRGDALVAEFNRASDAVTASLAFQAANRARNQALSDEVRPDVRIGIALGEVVIADHTVTGAGVVLAQRLEQLALPNGVTVQGAVYETVPRRLPVTYEFLGEQSLKGFEETIRAYSVTSKDDVALPIPEAGLGDESAIAPAGGTKLSGASGPSVAVLPFKNLSADLDQEFFADGLSEDIILALSASRSFPVLASSSTFVFKGRGVDAQTAGRELGAGYVLEGSVRRAGNRLRVTVELVNVGTRLQLWSERYDRSMDDLFAVQDDITTTVVAIVEPEINAEEMRRVLVAQPLSVMSAYELAQKGFWHLSKNTNEDYLSSLPLFESSIGADSSYARAYAGMSQGKYTAGMRLWEDRPTAMEDAIRLGRSALDLDERDPRALRYFGGAHVLLRRYDEGLDALRRAITVQPSYATAYSQLAFALDFVGEFEDAIEAEMTTERLRPGDRTLHVCMMSRAIATYQMGDYETAERVSKASLALNDAFWMSNLILAASLGQRGDTGQSREAVERVGQLLPSLTPKRLSTLLPFRDQIHLDKIVEGLKKAGMTL